MRCCPASIDSEDAHAARRAGGLGRGRRTTSRSTPRSATRQATDRAFAAADHVVAMDFHIGRVTGVPMEPRSALGHYDAASGRYTLYAGSGGAVRQKRELATILGIAPESVRVLSYDVGGNFGTRNRVFVEFGLVLWAAQEARPAGEVHRHALGSVPERLSGPRSRHQGRAGAAQGRPLSGHARDQHQQCRRALRLALAARQGRGPDPRLLRHPGGDAARAWAVFTNTMPTNAYRSSGRPEVTFAIERLIDIAAARARLRPHRTAAQEPRSRPQAMPYRNAVGMTYDSGRYEENMDWAMDIADWKGFAQRKREAAKRGKLLGRGLANYVESSIGAPNEQARITVRPEGRVDVVIGTQPSGQGHETSFAQVVSDLLHVPVETVKIILGDTDVVKVGGGSHSGRSMRHAATVFSKAAVDLIAKGKRIAAVRPRHDARRRSSSTTAASRARDTNRTFDFLELASEAARHDAARGPQGRHRGRHRQRDARSGVSQRLRDLRGRGRSRHRRGEAHPLRLGRRRRPLHQSADRARPDPRRDRAGRRPGAVGAVLRRARLRPAADRLVHGLRHAARRHPAVVHAPRSPRCSRRPIRSASRPAAKAAPPPRPRRSSAPSSTRCASSACATSRCRRRPTMSGATIHDGEGGEGEGRSNRSRSPHPGTRHCNRYTGRAPTGRKP